MLVKRFLSVLVMVESQKKYTGAERRKSFWGHFFYPLPERRVRKVFIRSLKRRVAVTAVITIVAAIALAVSLDNVLRYYTLTKQKHDTGHIAFEINAYVVQHYNKALTHLVASDQVFYVLNGLQQPDNSTLVEELKVARNVLGASLVYVMDEAGTVVGSSPYENGKTVTGNNYRFRPYFTEAMVGRPSQYAALGVTTGTRGIYFSQPVQAGSENKTIGAVVIKIPLTLIDTYMNRRADEYASVLLSPHGVVFSSTNVSWLFHTVYPITPTQRATVIESRQFNNMPLEPLPFTIEDEVVNIEGERYLVGLESLELEGWTVATLKPFPFPYTASFILTFIVFFTGVVAIIAFLFVYKDELLTEEVKRGMEKSRMIEESRKATLKELETILAASLVGIIFVRDGFITNVNEKMCSILGYTEEEMLGSDVRRYFTNKKAFRRFVQRYARQLALRDLENIEYLLRSRDGTAIPCSLSGRAIDTNDLTEGVVWVVEDIRERKKAEKELERARNEAVTASQAKSEFLANMSHEIRTPLNGIIGLTEFLLDMEHEAGMRNKLKLVHSSGKRLMRIINDILEFSKNEVANIEIEPAPFSLYGTLVELIKNFEVQAAEKNIFLKLDFDANLPQVLIGDDFRIMQVMYNLLGNGIKFTEHGGVTVRIRRQRATGRDRIMVLFEVIDTGIGIDSRQQDLVFDAFAQAESNHSRRYGGTGLGLPISRRIVHQLGGNIHLDSIQGEGSRFWFILPFSTPETYAVEQKEKGDAGDVERILTDTNFGHILLAEDDFINTTLAVSLLEQVGYTVKTVNNGQAVLDALEQEEFDCILMDIQMPLMDGHEATRTIRRLEQEKGGHVPIIAMTACVMQEDIETYMTEGMDAYLGKPINRVELYTLLKKFCKSSKKAAENTKS